MQGMDWKRYYRDEMLDEQTRDYLEALLADLNGDEEIDSLIERGAILSFPHTAAHYIGPLQARVVSGLYRNGIERVVALGVLHASPLPAPYAELYRTALDEERSSAERLHAYSVLCGGFSPDRDAIDTSFGRIPCQSIARAGQRGVRTDRAGLLANEFSLDSFFSLMALYARVHGVPPIPVSPIYVGMTRNPLSGSFEVAGDLAWLLRGSRDDRTAIVTTGDIVHYGTAYTPAEKMLDLEEDQLEPHFRAESQRIISLAMEKRDLAGAFLDSNEILRSDQRYILPVVCQYLGNRAQFKILSFSLSDYSLILNTPRPCVVASALVAYIPSDISPSE